MKYNIETLFNISLIVGVILINVAAFIFQLSLFELPCPLCLMQRLGILAIAIGPLLNLRYGFYPIHYSLVLVSAIFAAGISLRHVALHIVPGSDPYTTTPIFGLHLCTWVFILMLLIILTTSIMLGINRQYLSQNNTIQDNRIVNILSLGILALILANIISTFLQCGFLPCPDDPVGYRMLSYYFNNV